MVRATAARAARSNLPVAAEVRLALPWPRTTNAARRPRGRGRRALPTRRSAEATSAPHLYVTASASARSRRGPGSAALPPLAAAVPGARREAPDGRAHRSEPASLERCHTWRSQVFSTEYAPEALGEETAREVHALLRLSVEPKTQDIHPTTPTRVARVGPSATSKGHFSPGPLTVPEPPRVPVRTVPAFSCSVTISQNPITSQSKPPPIGQWGG